MDGSREERGMTTTLRDAGRFKLSSKGIEDLWRLSRDNRLAVDERVSLALALGELERERARRLGCR